MGGGWLYRGRQPMRVGINDGGRSPGCARTQSSPTASGDLSRGSRSRDNLSIGLASGITATDLDAGLRSLRETQAVQAREYTARELPKFAECLPPDLAASTVATRYADTESVNACLAEPIREVASHG